MKSFIKNIIRSKQNIADKNKGTEKGLVQPTPMGTGPENRHGMPTLPIGQKVVKNWPILDLGIHPHISLETWCLKIEGWVENPVSLSWEQFMGLPQTEDVSDFHCVTTWSRMDNHWIGVRFSDLMALAKPKPEAQYVLTTGYDVSPMAGVPYTTNLSLKEAMHPDVLLVHQWEGEPLPLEHGGPCRMITPRLYAWKGAKWIHKITLLANDHSGFWEVRGYSNTANPWLNERYSH